MFKTWVGKFDKKIFCSLAVLSVAAAALFLAVPASAQKADSGFVAKSFPQVARSSGTDNLGGTTIPGTGVGAIPDDAAPGCGAPGGAPLNITFNSAVTGTLTDVEVNLTGTHTWVGDLDVTLIAPNGATHKIFAFTGSTTATGCGADDDLGGLYAFGDTYAGNWWTEAGTATPMAPGNYRTSTAGGIVGGGAISAMTPTFAAVNPTGTWTLRVIDNGNGDTGSITAANLILTASAPATQNIVDFNGDGRTDFATVRNTGGGPTGQITWFINLNGPGTTYGSAWGLATDAFVPVDYDGDNKTDIAVWRPVSTGQPSGNAFFYILNSATNTVTVSDFGQTGDDPSVVGDYDGDGKADVAVYRGGATPGAPSTWYYRGSLTPANVTFVPWGQNGDFPAPGDYDGDGKHDFVIQRNNGGGSAAFWRRQTTAGQDVVVFGTPTDVIVPGDYDGDGKTDIAVVRGIGGQINWFHRKSSDGAIVQTIFGNSATDFVTHGDYDGDGKTDQSIWRPSLTAGASAFWVNGSASGVGALPFGQNGDFPVANYNRH